MPIHGNNISISYRKRQMQRENVFASEIWKGNSFLTFFFLPCQHSSISLHCPLHMTVSKSHIWTSSGEITNNALLAKYLNLIKNNALSDQWESLRKKIIKPVLAQNRHWRIAVDKILQNTLWRTILHSLRVGSSSAPDLQLLQLWKLCRKHINLY